MVKRTPADFVNESVKLAVILGCQLPNLGSSLLALTAYQESEPWSFGLCRGMIDQAGSRLKPGVA